MKTGGIGGANTKTGLIYEGKVDLRTFLIKAKELHKFSKNKNYILNFLHHVE